MHTTETTDLLHGLPAIAHHLGIKTRQAKYRAERGAIPTFRMGRTVCALRSDIDAHLRAQA